MDDRGPITWKMRFCLEGQAYVTDRSILINERYVFQSDRLPDGVSGGDQLQRKRNYSVLRNVLDLPAIQRFRVADLVVKNEWLYRYADRTTLNRKYIAFLLQRIPEEHLFFALSGGSRSPIHLYRDDEHIGVLLPVITRDGSDDDPVEIAKSGDAKAQYSMAQRCHIRAYKSAAFAGEALKWYAAAAGQGHPEAFLELGRCYWEGVLVPVDLAKSLALLERAVELGCKRALRSRAGLIKHMGPEQYRSISARIFTDMIQEDDWRLGKDPQNAE